MPEYNPDLVQILDLAIDMLRKPQSIVIRYEQFATDANGLTVGYGDPAACRFCAAGVVEHAATLIREPGRVLPKRSAEWPTSISCDEQDAIAAACRVETAPRNDYWAGEPDLADTLLEIFERAWSDGRDDPEHDSPDRDLVAAHLITYLQRGRDEIAASLVLS
jgi:hypothetical protein